MQPENSVENIPYFQGQEIVDVTQEEISGLKTKGLNVEEFTVTEPAKGLDHVTGYYITGRVHQDGEYVDPHDKSKPINVFSSMERFVHLLVSPDTGRVYIVRVSSSTGDPVRDVSSASRQLEKFCRKQ